MKGEPCALASCFWLRCRRVELISSGSVMRIQSDSLVSCLGSAWSSLGTLIELSGAFFPFRSLLSFWNTASDSFFLICSIAAARSLLLCRDARAC